MRLYCPTGCGSDRFRIHSPATLVSDVSVDEDGELVVEEVETHDHQRRREIICETCSHSWRTERDLDLPLVVIGGNW